jgi:hypothetical protein
MPIKQKQKKEEQEEEEESSVRMLVLRAKILWRWLKESWGEQTYTQLEQRHLFKSSRQLVEFLRFAERTGYLKRLQISHKHVIYRPTDEVVALYVEMRRFQELKEKAIPFEELKSKFKTKSKEDLQALFLAVFFSFGDAFVTTVWKRKDVRPQFEIVFDAIFLEYLKDCTELIKETTEEEEKQLKQAYHLFKQTMALLRSPQFVKENLLPPPPPSSSSSSVVLTKK